MTGLDGSRRGQSGGDGGHGGRGGNGYSGAAGANAYTPGAKGGTGGDAGDAVLTGDVWVFIGVQLDHLVAALELFGDLINDGPEMTRSTLMSIMGRMSAYSGQPVTYEEALNSAERLGPTSYEWGDVPALEVSVPGSVVDWSDIQS